MLGNVYTLSGDLRRMWTIIRRWNLFHECVKCLCRVPPKTLLLECTGIAWSLRPQRSSFLMDCIKTCLSCSAAQRYATVFPPLWSTPLDMHSYPSYRGSWENLDSVMRHMSVAVFFFRMLHAMSQQKTLAFVTFLNCFIRLIRVHSWSIEYRLWYSCLLIVSTKLTVTMMDPWSKNNCRRKGKFHLNRCFNVPGVYF